MGLLDAFKCKYKECQYKEPPVVIPKEVHLIREVVREVKTNDLELPIDYTKFIKSDRENWEYLKKTCSIVDGDTVPSMIYKVAVILHRLRGEEIK